MQMVNNTTQNCYTNTRPINDDDILWMRVGHLCGGRLLPKPQRPSQKCNELRWCQTHGMEANETQRKAYSCMCVTNSEGKPIETFRTSECCQCCLISMTVIYTQWPIAMTMPNGWAYEQEGLYLTPWSRLCKLEEQIFECVVFWYYDVPQGLTSSSGAPDPLS